MAMRWRRALARLRTVAWWTRHDEQTTGAGETADHETAELTSSFWRVYDQRMATVKFSDVARRFPALIGQAVRLGWQANKRDTAATIILNLASGVFGGYALFATTGVLEALFAAGPTPQRVRAALPSLILVAISTAVRSGVQTAAGWAQSRLEPAVDQITEDGLYFSDYVAFCEDAQSRISPPSTVAAPADFGRITASGVTFSYPGAEEPTLHEVSVEIGRGEVVALVGENGSGKTTLAKILAGLYRPQAGTVCWDDVSIADVAGEPLREQIAVIAQDHGNWPLSVRDNIVMGRPFDEALLESAAVSSGADTVIAELDRGYDTLLARQFKDGAELSGGQWQRIAAARGFYRTAPLLIMDEPTAALDARAEYALFSSLRTLARDRTVLIITHRLASVRHADRIYVLAHGKVAESGTHAELMALGGQYAELYTIQASQYDPVA